MAVCGEARRNERAVTVVALVRKRHTRSGKSKRRKTKEDRERRKRKKNGGESVGGQSLWLGRECQRASERAAMLWAATASLADKTERHWLLLPLLVAFVLVCLGLG